MSTNNKKSTLTQALLEMEEITSAIKEESKKSLNALLSEAVRDAIRESCDESEDDEYEVVDDEKNDAIDTENEELNVVIEEFTNLNKDNQKYIDDLNFDITNLKISVSSFNESEVSIQEMTDMINKEIIK